MLFLRYESFRGYIRLYPVTSLILLANLILFLLTALKGGFMETSRWVLIDFGAMANFLPYAQEYWRYFTAMFLHGGLDHFLFNSFAIFIFAPPLERILGRWRYAVLYAGSGLIGNYVSQMLQNVDALVVSIGASGAIYGIYGAFLYMGLFRKDVLDRNSNRTVIIILVIGFIYSFVVPYVNLLAHFGGFVGGFLLFPLLFRRFLRRG